MFSKCIRLKPDAETKHFWKSRDPSRSTLTSPASPDHRSNLFTHITSSRLALQVIVTQAAQRKLSAMFALITDVDMASRWNGAVCTANNQPAFCC